MFTRFTRALSIAALLPLMAWSADVLVINGDPPGAGFNNPTPATPVGGNPGTTVGQQALNVFERAAAVWGSKLVSKQPILVIAFFTPLGCTATSGTLGAAGAYWYFSDVPAAKGGKQLNPGTWYPAALAEKLTRQDIVVDPAQPFEIIAFFNSRLGQPGCLNGSGWYYGLDNREPANLIDLLAVVLHEFAHGLGFAVSPTSGNTGARAQGLPAIWENHMLDMTTGKRWIEMTDAERAASARNNWKLVWAGRKASNVVPSVLDFRTEIDLLSSADAPVEALPASFGGAVPKGRNREMLVAPNDGGGASLLDGCEPFAVGAGVPGNWVLVNRGTCTFVQKAANAQAAGAVGLLIANNDPAVTVPFSPGGADPNITIPVLGITLQFGATLRAAAPAEIAVQLDSNVRVGTEDNYPRLYAPTAFAGGSSVSHWDISATPNLLMEPAINSDLTSSVKNPDDLTKSLFADIGW